MGAGGLRDPRMARGRGEPEPEKSGLTFSRGFGIVFGMFVLGIAVAFGYFMITRPNPQIDNTNPVPTNTTAPPPTPTTAPKATPTGLAPGAGPAIAFIYAGESSSL